MFSVVLSRVKTLVPAFRQFGIAALLEDAVADMRAWPNFYLFAPRGKAGPNENIDDTLLQHVSDNFGGLIGVKNVADGTGEAALAEIEALYPQVYAALLNFEPVAGQGPIQLVDYSIPYARDGIVVRLENFRSTHFERA